MIKDPVSQKIDIEKIKKKIEERPDKINLEELSNEYGITRQWLSKVFINNGFNYVAYKEKEFKKFKRQLKKDILVYLKKEKGKVTNQEIIDYFDITPKTLYLTYERSELQDLKRSIKNSN